MTEISELDLQNLRHLIGGFDTTHCKMQDYAQKTEDMDPLKSNLSFFKILLKYYIKNNIEIKNRGQIIRILSIKKGYEYTYPFLFDISLGFSCLHNKK